MKNALFQIIRQLLSFVRFIFRPTSSKPENIRSIYYEAEYNGRLQECQRYLDNCNVSLLGLVSKMISIGAHKMI